MWDEMGNWIQDQYPSGAGQEPAYSGASPGPFIDYTTGKVWGTTGGTDMWTAITTGIKSASGILGARYAVPQLNPGQLIQTGPNGQSLMYQGTAGNMSLPSLSSFSSLGGSSSIWLLGGVALLAIMMFKGK